MRDVLCNTSPLLYLHQLGRLDLLPGLYVRVTIPRAVAAELREGARIGHAVPDTGALPWITTEEVPQSDVLRLVTDLDEGEREVIALALRHPQCLLLLDDGAARRYATMLGLTLTGTLGVLVRAKQSGLIDQVRPCLDELNALGFRMSGSVRAHVLALAKESAE